MGLRDWLGDFCPGSLFILDEAHVAAPASESKYAIDSQTTRAVRDVAKRFEHRLFLSATPHNGHSNSFSSLLEILDPQRFTRGVPVKSAAVLRPVMVRRLKAELRGHIESPIPERVVEAIEIDHLPASAPELALSAMLAEYSEILERRLAEGSKRTRSAGKLVSLALQKRLLSSVEAFARTLAVHRKTAEKKAQTSASSLTAPAEKQAALFDEDDDLGDEQVSELEDVEVARATKAGASATDDARARQLVDEMSEIAAEARGQPDAKVRALLAWIRAHQCSDKGVWRSRRILIFTEYVDTKSYLVAQLDAALGKTDRADERILTIHGGMDEEAREAVKQAFNDERHPVRILIGTDAAREGLNLQAQCADLFHFDLPWNPGRMEQRNGRIDRILQPQDTVYCRYFLYTQRPEDAVLSALVKKSERIRKQLGSLADILSHRLEATLENGIKRGAAPELLRKLEAADPEELRGPVAANELEQARDADKELREQLKELSRLDQKAAQHLDLRPDRLCDVVNVGLALAGQPPLVERAGSPGVFDVPALDKLAGADATWRDIMDTLRRPRTRKMPEWEWRAKNPPRPVSFAPSTTLASETVQLHLQHKLTQRALAQFRSQAFGEDKLSRVTVLIDPDPNYRQKRILALGRLSLYGDGASRLHEEILAVAALWEEGDDPSRLQPFKTLDAEEKALESLHAVLSRDNPPPVSRHTIAKVMAHAARDEDALWETLKKKARSRAIWAEEKLRQRARVEADEMQRILDVQRSAIDKELKERRQLALPWTSEEQEQRKQHEADTRHIEKRRGDLDREMKSEPERIRDQYEVKHHRLERVGLVYLWPVTA